jgi:murein L,D-transpeptidase YcbB/YkuD
MRTLNSIPLLPRWLACCLLFSAFISFAGPIAAQDTGTDIRWLLETDNLTIGGAPVLTREILLQIYGDNGFRPYWTRDGDIRELLELIADSPNHGLNPADYNYSALQELLAQREARPGGQLTARADVLLSESLIRYGYHRRFGKIKARDLDADINYRRALFRNQSPGKTLQEIFAAPSLQSFIEMAAPEGPYYDRIQHWLASYRAIADEGGWPAVTAGPALREGDSGPRVAALRARLAVSGDLPEGAATDLAVFDAALAAGVRVFQRRHQLQPDGIVGNQTIAALNVPVEYRIDQLRTSLERLRWVNQEAADTLVAVNIAGYTAYYFQDGELVWTTRAMVGKSYRRTPVFRGDIAYMEFNPTWTIPPGILRNDTLPAIKQDPNYLASKNIRVIDRNGNIVDPASVDWSQYTRGVPYTLRQDPGPNNALGTVKFIFPNKHFVFLHDTPHRELFDYPERAFSSGCIRIEDPLRLAELLLNDPQRHTRQDLQAIVDS